MQNDQFGNYISKDLTFLFHERTKNVKNLNKEWLKDQVQGAGLKSKKDTKGISCVQLEAPSCTSNTTCKEWVEKQKKRVLFAFQTKSHNCIQIGFLFKANLKFAF